MVKPHLYNSYLTSSILEFDYYLLILTCGGHIFLVILNSHLFIVVATCKTQKYLLLIRVTLRKAEDCWQSRF
jgi:hypothetical protein